MARAVPRSVYRRHQLQTLRSAQHRRGSSSTTCCQLNCTLGTAREEWRTIPRGRESLFLGQSEKFSAVALTKIEVEEYKVN
jgi:hypothetical protein